MKQITPLLLASCALLIGCAQTATPPMSAQEITSEISGKSFDYSGSIQGTRFSGVMTYNANGNLFVDTQSGIAEGGTWRLSGNQVCTRLVALRGGQESCFSVFRNEDGSYRTSHGFTVTPRATAQ